MKNNIPWLLIGLRGLLGFVMIACSYFHVPNYNTIAISLLTIGLISDIFDGIIARKLGISTPFMRRMDSSTDQLFFLCVALATYVQCAGFFKNNAVMLVLLFGAEALIYLVCYVKFRKEIATHSLGAKLWTLILFATLVEVMVHCRATYLFYACFWVGIITRLEIMAIIFTLKEWTNDVPTIWHAVQLRNGKRIQRNKYFNG